MATLDTDHTWELIIDAIDRTSIMSPHNCSWRESEAGRSTSLDIRLLDLNQSLTWSGWEEVTLTSDPGQINEEIQFGGYLTQWAPIREGETTERGWDLHFEGYAVRMARANATAKAYVGQTPSQIVTDVMSQAGFGDFTIDVESGSAIELFVVAEGDKLLQALERLMLLCDPTSPWVWFIGPDKVFYCGPTNFRPAAYSIADAQASPNFTTSFPPSANGLVPKSDGVDMSNRVRVVGGQSQSDNTTENFVFGDAFVNADGDFVFNLAHTLISAFVSIIRTRSGVTYQYLTSNADWGWDWYDPVGRKVYLDKDGGTIRFVSTELTTGDTVTIIYRWLDRVDVVRTNSALYTSMGFYLDHPPIYDPALTTEQSASDYGDAILSLSGSPKVDGSLTMERLGLHAGSYVSITSTTLGLSGSYFIRQVVHTLFSHGRRVRSEIGFGDSKSVLFDMLSKSEPIPISTPTSDGETGIQRVVDRLEALKPGTYFQWPA